MGATLRCGAWGFSCFGAWALGVGWAPVTVAHGLGCSEAYGIFLDQGPNPVLAGGFLTVRPPGKPSQRTVFMFVLECIVVILWSPGSVKVDTGSVLLVLCACSSVWHIVAAHSVSFE